LVGGENPAYVDAVLGQMMGYNISRLPAIYNAIYHRKSQFAGPYLEDFQTCVWEDSTAKLTPLRELPNLEFVKPEHWNRAASSRNASSEQP